LPLFFSFNSSRPKRRNTVASGEIKIKNKMPRTIGLTIRAKSRLNFIHQRLNGAKIAGFMKAIKNIAALNRPMTHCWVSGAPRSRNTIASRANITANIMPKLRSVPPGGGGDLSSPRAFDILYILASWLFCYVRSERLKQLSKPLY